MEELALPSFSSHCSFSRSCSPRRRDDPERESAFELMCRDYEELRIKAAFERIPESEFVKFASRSSSRDPSLFGEIHELWLSDIKRAQMHRVDPFQAALQLLRSRLNPLNPDEKYQRKQLRTDVMGPLKKPTIERGAAPFVLPANKEIDSRSQKQTTSLKKLFEDGCFGAEDSSGSGRLRIRISSLTKRI